MENKSQDQEKNPQNSINIDNIVKAVPLGYAFLVFCGALYFQFYYNTFRINIFRYLDISEIAVSFLPIIIIIMISLGFIMCFFPFAKLCIKEKHLSKFATLINKRPSITTSFLCLICAGYLFLSYNKLESSADSFHFNPHRVLWWWAFLIPAVLIVLFTDVLKNIIINLLVIFIMTVVHDSISEIQETIENAKSRSYTIITTNQGTIITNKDHYYVNRTNHYIFLYNSSDGTYEDIPLTEIQKISFTMVH